MDQSKLWVVHWTNWSQPCTPLFTTTSLHAGGSQTVAGVAVEAPATATAACTSPCRAAAEVAAPCSPVPGPPSLTLASWSPLAPTARPAPARARRARAMPRTPCAAQARPRQGQAPARPRARHASPPCPPCSPDSPQRSRTPPPAYGEHARPRVPSAPRPPCAARPL